LPVFKINLSLGEKYWPPVETWASTCCISFSSARTPEDQQRGTMPHHLTRSWFSPPLLNSVPQGGHCSGEVTEIDLWSWEETGESGHVCFWAAALGWLKLGDLPFVVSTPFFLLKSLLGQLIIS
jgi:hypothetical protein